MEIEMTWTVIYKNEDNSLGFKALNGPHGRSEALKFITNNFNLFVVAIIPGSHEVTFLNKTH